jgi:hypothetical protein
MRYKKIVGFAIAAFCTLIFQKVQAQNSKLSEGLVIYNYDTKTVEKGNPIPFDRPFTMSIPKLSSKNIKTVELYETSFKHGHLELVGTRVFIDSTHLNSLAKSNLRARRVVFNEKYSSTVVDANLEVNKRSDTLQLFFPPLKPNRNFDINIVTLLNPESRKLLIQSGIDLLTDTAKARKLYDKFNSSTVDKIENSKYTTMTFEQFKVFFVQHLRTACADIIATDYNKSSVFTLNDFQALELLIKLNKLKPIKDRHLLVEVFKSNKLSELQVGTYDINKIFDPFAETDTSDVIQRIENLSANLTYLDSIIKQAGQLISIGSTTFCTGTLDADINLVYNNIRNIRLNTVCNLKRLSNNLEQINTAVDDDTRLANAIFLSGSTLTPDLKTAGANVLFMDAGLTNLMVPDIQNNLVNIPKLYLGVSIYFRSIDKNTRRNQFPLRRSYPHRLRVESHGSMSIDSCGKMRVDSYGIPVDSRGNIGPDFSVLAHRSIWQSLCLNMGLTLGPMKSKQFDNLYNDVSLMIGPAYRITRAFKVSAGVSFVNRSSRNPLISEMHPAIGGYFSLSVDIDFIQGIKEITSILLK